ncbi:hypothetical protein [Leptolyngbya sp. BC1307]|nr:hypothetical protein [Leptolyngbya sp. BC1307]
MEFISFTGWGDTAAAEYEHREGATAGITDTVGAGLAGDDGKDAFFR